MMNPDQLQLFLQMLAADHAILAPIVYMFFRMAPAVFAPLPGFALDGIALTTFGFFWGFIYSYISITLGSIVAYLIARYLRNRWFKKYFDQPSFLRWSKKIEDKKGFWAFTFLRFITTPVADFVSYAAGLTTIKFKPYLLATIIGTLPAELLYFWIGDHFVRYNFVAFSVVLTFGVLLVVMIPLIIKTWRYYHSR